MDVGALLDSPRLRLKKVGMIGLEKAHMKDRVNPQL